MKAGSCLRRCLLENFEDPEVIEQSRSGECCCSCDVEVERNFNIKDTASMMLKALKEFITIPQVKDVNEDKLISWLRGSKRDWLSSQEIQTFIDSSETYGQGQFLENQILSKEWWSIHLRQMLHLNLININFKITTGLQFARAYRTYVISDEGENFLKTPRCIQVLPPSAVDSRPTRKSAKKTSLTSGRNKHYLPKVQELQKENSHWFELTKRSDYEYPGFEQGDKIAHCKYIKKSKEFGFCQRVHYMWDDCQLTKRHTSTQAIDTVTEGQKNKIKYQKGVL